MPTMLIFGMGYSASRIADRLRAQGWEVAGTSRSGRDGTIAFADDAAVAAALVRADAVLVSIPPDAAGDPVLRRYGDTVRATNWIGYLSSTGVYGDTGGAWVDESAPVGGRRSARNDADQAWLALGARVFRLPGIYGPGRSALDRVAEGKAHRIDLPGQVFSRVHVDDIASGVIAGLDGPPGAYNIADDAPCGQNAVIEFAAQLLGLAPPPLQTMDQAGLSPMARSFYAENRRVANGKAKRVLGWQPAYPDYRAGLRALSAITRPSIASADPATASPDQR
ncbi:MAG: SDR family NAD(P)-dependent oxidoreductase [Sphingomonas sp.]|uniref:SDR family NAD(P)-dependent oxidoreductase n=1 Tax=Sphingomonas sp. TaxID=28214 RepID=UPI0025DE9691|nr:SDR family NAD(P)-dependent oxidoreductase [Sphingomonas sp.]MBY0282458.1 SDR family NAD(P)-dependent oxidoreductase [Sphingomonas sp.]